MSIEAQFSELLEQLTQKPTHGSFMIKEAAHILLVQLCNFLQNFPSPEGIEVVASQISESDDVQIDPPPFYYIYNDFALISLVEIPYPDGSHRARVIVRDCTGKYSWDCQINYNNYTHQIPKPLSLLCEPIIAPVTPEPPIYSQSDRQPGVAPKANNEVGPPVEPLDDLLQYLGEAFPDCLPDGGAPLNQPSDSHKEFKAGIQLLEKDLLQQDTTDWRTISKLRSQLPDYTFWWANPPSNYSSLSPSHHCRLLLNHLGVLSYDKQPLFSMVEDSQRFHRSLQQLDKNPSREMLKIGLIYVKEGQDDQKVVLRNDTRSELYHEFVSGLGWPVDLATHRGYLGGLDPRLTTGITAPYFANATMELIFHEVTSMPLNPSDAQQIHKKRHVGNDIVHIVYSEHSADYEPNTITSQFNDAHIIVYPLSNGMFRIQVYRKENVVLFGPLQHGMCVNKRLLSSLVRQTAINANRYVRYNSGSYTRPFATR
jgi:hypothetical protein